MVAPRRHGVGRGIVAACGAAIGVVSGAGVAVPLLVMGEFIIVVVGGGKRRRFGVQQGSEFLSAYGAVCISLY